MFDFFDICRNFYSFVFVENQTLNELRARLPLYSEEKLEIMLEVCI